MGKERLKNAVDEKDYEKILADFENDRIKLSEQLANDKRAQMSGLRDKLAQRREAKERRLARQHRNEAKSVDMDEDLVVSSQENAHHKIANLENKISTEIDEIQEEANNEQVVDRKSVLLKALEESGALESERLTIINKEFEDMEEAARRNRHVQLGKLKKRMKNRRKVR